MDYVELSVMFFFTNIRHGVPMIFTQSYYHFL